MKRAAARSVRPLADRFWEKVNKLGPVPAHRPRLGRCWVWVGSTRRDGYGQIGCNVPSGRRRCLAAHRVSWTIRFGIIPKKLWVLHACDRRVCVRPSHLFLGTPRDNSRDMGFKGRQALQINPKLLAGDRHWSRRQPARFRRVFRCPPERRARGSRHGSKTRPEATHRGEACGWAKLNTYAVRAIRRRRAAGETGVSLAKEFAVTPAAICAIFRGRSWRCVAQ